jgi:hypothetical protein
MQLEVVQTEAVRMRVIRVDLDLEEKEGCSQINAPRVSNGSLYPLASNILRRHLLILEEIALMDESQMEDKLFGLMKWCRRVPYWSRLRLVHRGE